MRFRVMGCSGGIGDGHRTTSFLVDDDILIDAGTGLGTLALDELSKIDHVFLSHSHMDHIALLPMLVDSTLTLREAPIVVHASDATLAVLDKHVFNWKVYPDFRNIGTTDRAPVTFEAMAAGAPVALGRRTLTAIPVTHTVPTVAYHLSSGDAGLVVATDMTVSDAFWPAVNAIDDLKYLLIEAAFQNARLEICDISGHLCPSLLEAELKKLKLSPEVFIVHMKPSAEPYIRQEIAALKTGFDLGFLADGDVLNF